MRTRRRNWTFDWSTTKQFWDRGQTKRTAAQVRIDEACAAIFRAAARADARGSVGRVEGVRFVETNMPKTKIKKLTIGQRVALLERQLAEPCSEYVSAFERQTFAGAVRTLQRQIADLEVRLGDPGTPKYLFSAELSCGKAIKVVARNVEEALVRAQRFLRQEDHEAEVVKVERVTDEAVDVC